MKWVPVPLYEGFFACRDGRVRGLRGKVMSPRVSSDGYARVCTVKGATRFTAVHRMVALAFLGLPREEDAVAHHKNSDPLDNRACNLEWKSRKGHASDHRKVVPSAALVRRVKKRLQGTTGEIAKASREFGIAYHFAYKIAKGRYDEDA